MVMPPTVEPHSSCVWDWVEKTRIEYYSHSVGISPTHDLGVSPYPKERLSDMEEEAVAREKKVSICRAVDANKR